MNENLKRELIGVIKPGGEYTLDWQYTNTEVDKKNAKYQKNVYDVYLKDIDKALLLLGTAKKNYTFSQSVEFLYKVAFSYVQSLCKNPDLESLRYKAKALPDKEEKSELLDKAPYINGEEYLDENWITHAFKRLNKAFENEIKEYKGSVAEYFLSKNPDIHFAGKVYFHLVENKKGDYPFAFLATYAAKPSAIGKSKHLPLKNALAEYGKNSEKLLELLSAVHKAAKQSEFLSELLDTGEIFYPIGLNENEAYTFLKEVPFYEDAGILCRIPDWWRKKTSSLNISVKIGTKEPSYVGSDALLDFNINMSLGGEKISPEEIKRLITQSEGLAFIKGKWVEVDPERLRETLKAYENAQKEAQKGNLTMMEAMRMELTAKKALNINSDVCDVEVSNGEWLEKLFDKLRKPETVKSVKCGRDFNATLREYQKNGVKWLRTMKNLSLGACLADDMGLGKTIQVIALLNGIRMQKEERVLLVLPASLIGNWTAEIERFAPKLKYHIVHPKENKDKPVTNNKDKGIYITTYGIVIRREWIKQSKWDMIILDEAQAIKNPGTKQSKIVKQLKAKSRIALTGTPMENRLSDLWSIFDFLNKGLLGSAKEFSDFTKKLKTDDRGYKKLKKMVSPFILRRLKTDKNIISDLPEKIEMKTYSTLTKTQAALYSSMVDQLKRKLETSEGINRKGLVLASLMKFKQICNHPDQYLGQHTYKEKESGKYQRLREICETIYEKRERVLIFTQFREIIEPLSDFLKDVFMHEGLVLHGQTPVEKRKALVNKFQGHEYVPFMILSIKAGGTGLNLTAANHIVHFDRWWNPAVENQATDRAFRIGQEKNVVVHKFITKGTVEEKIDKMIEEKSNLTEKIIPDSKESWITEMDDNELMNLFKLEY